MRYLIAILCIALNVVVYGQTTEHDSADTMQSRVNTLTSIPGKSLEYIEKKYRRLGATIQKQNEKVLQRMQEKEAKIRKKLAVTDSLKAAALFGKSEERYRTLTSEVKGQVDKTAARVKEYIPGIDSIASGLKFLSQSPYAGVLNSEKIAGVTGSVNELQGRLQQANQVAAFIREREEQLKEQLINSGLGKQLTGLSKEVYYYKERISQYKQLLNDKKKLEQAFVNTVTRLPAFQKFMQEHSQLAQFFRLQGSEGNVVDAGGLQTRAMLQGRLQQTFSAPGINPQQYVQQQLGAAQGELDKIKNKLNELGGGGSSDMTMPEFKPNGAKTKTFWERLEYGINIQNQRSNQFIPAVSDIAATVGFKISESKVIGLGASYKLGWGSGWNNIRFSSEGIGLRSYADIKAKGSLWISGGFEYNYIQRFNNFSEIKNMETWQKSALLGITKKYKVGKREGNMQLLYDFLANKQTPVSQPLKFRIGYIF